jgi:hypothetical protein
MFSCFVFKPPFLLKKGGMCRYGEWLFISRNKAPNIIITEVELKSKNGFQAGQTAML